MLDIGIPTTKQMLWERKLLDFSLRNNLLNTRLSRRVVPFISFEIERLEDHLQNGEDYYITPSPGKKVEPNADGMYDSMQQASACRDEVTKLIGNHRIASYLTETELLLALKYVYRTARTALEENGANSLFLTLGMLRWYETEKSEQARYAPILLLPVDIVRKSGSNYVIRKRDEDIILNITLAELLKQNFKISLDHLKDLPKDEMGVDVQKVFAEVRQAIRDQKKWQVIEESMLGLFSFNKFVMWNDIHSNADKLKENEIVAALQRMEVPGHDGDKQPDPIDARTIDKENTPQDFSIPLDVDSSQMEAIVESGRGRNFILHGPPGTGKSQTITNMIANALYQGKRVLFVAEKMAALSVVQSRLEKIGLAPFCLELHSNKVTKKHFLTQMDEVLKVTRIKSPEKYAQKSEELYNERKELISYMEALHEKASNGLSLYDCISEYLRIQGEECSEELPPVETVDSEYIEKCREQVEQTEAVLSLIGTPSQHPLYGLEPKDNRQETLDTLQALLQDIRSHQAAFSSALESMNGSIPLGLKTEADIRWLEMYVACLANEKQTAGLREQIVTGYSEELLRMDVNAYRREWETINGKWFLPRYFAKRSFLKSLQRYGSVFESSVEEVFTLVSNYQEARKNLAAQTDEMEAFAHANGFSHQQRVQPQGVGNVVFSADAIIKENKTLTDLTGRVNMLIEHHNSKEDIVGHAVSWTDNYQQMKDWYHWVSKKQQLHQLRLQPAIAMIEQGTSPQEAVNAFLKGIFHRLIGTTIDGNEQLRMFNGLKFRQQIEKYKRDTAHFQELSKAELYSKLASRVPAVATATAEGSEISILKRNIANGGRGNSIRSIIDNIPSLLPRLCPCMLMSPISVAQYIDLSAEKFDLVIFDEASQMPTSEAVGAIARGKALVVVGDSKQMPPTSFFSTTQVDEEEADIDDMESILDDCITLSLCEHQLKWHYRSKHESLIAFSNSQYYDNELLTFPSADDHVAKVTLVPVEGVYDKGHTRSNPEESKAIVAEVVRRLSDPQLNKFSIGVVAFSKVQGNLIEDDLMEALDKHPDLKEIAFNAREPIFVKNLENVQGDERDIILFSIGYGADATGKVSMNFGPLNNSGGERRLNVAVSRARYEMMVFSSLRSSQIDLKRSSAKGVEGLKGFLEFAETGRLPMTAGTTKKEDRSVMAEQICAALTERGYVTEMSVGRSNFKVDIAVSTADHPEKYLLGILCDGRTYYETKTTRDREIVQPSVLRMLNWRVMRVYSIDWYENRERTFQQILDELQSAPSPEPAKTEEDSQPPVFDTSRLKASHLADPVVRDQNLDDYQEASILVPASAKEQFNPADKSNMKIIRQILEAEQPITEAYLCKRLAKVIGFAHSGVNIQRAVSAVLPKLYRDPLSLDGCYSYWLDKDSAKDYHSYRAPSPRTFMEIPAIEIVNAVKEVLREEFSLPKDKIPSVTARKLGFSTAGTKIAEVVRKVLMLMEQEGTVVVNNDQVLLKEE